MKHICEIERIVELSVMVYFINYLVWVAWRLKQGPNTLPFLNKQSLQTEVAFYNCVWPTIDIYFVGQ